MKLFRILDPFTLTLITVVLLASFFPAEGSFVPVVEGITTRGHRSAVFYAWREAFA